MNSKCAAMESDKKDVAESIPTSSLLVTRNSLKSRSSNCLMEAGISSWLPGLNLATPVTTTTTTTVATTNEWTNIYTDSSPRPSKDETSSQSNSNYGCGEKWTSPQMPSDKQRLKGSRKKKRSSKKRNLLDGEDKDEDQLSPLGRKIIVFVAVFLFLLCILLVGVTLRMGPVIDEMVRKGNEDIYRSMSAGASTSSPTTDGAGAVNSSTPSSGTPG